MQTYIFKRSKRNSRLVVAILFLSIAFISCEAVFEKDISKKTIEIKAPINNYSSSSQEILFWWEELAGADSYHIQIVKPSFDSVSALILDTVVTGTKFSILLTQGKYQWKIRGENSAYTTEYFMRSFSVVGDEDLSSQIVYLISPANLDTTNQSLLTFTWQPIAFATEYRFEIWRPNINGTCIHAVSLLTPQYQFSFSEDTSYTWRVMAVNSFTNTTYSSRSIFLDTHAPVTPTLLYPINNATSNTPIITFQWENDQGGGSSIYDSLYISSDYSFATQLKRVKSFSQTYNDSLSSGIHYWKVKSFDAAGNNSSFSNIFQLIVE